MSDSLAPPIIVPPHIHYLVLDAELRIQGISAGVEQFVEDLECLQTGIDIREGFPELFGCEDVLTEILAGEPLPFNIKGIIRTSPRQDLFYVDLYFRQYYPTPGGAPGLLLFIENVTDKMTLEQTLVQSTNETSLLLNALTASKDYINRIVTSIADALIVTTTSQIIKTVNQATEKLFGYSRTELIDQSLSLLIQDAEPVFAELAAILEDSGSGEVARNLEVTCRTQSGSKLTVAFSCSLIQTETEDSDRRLALSQDLVYIGRDITERKRTQQRLAVQYAIANILSASATLEEATHNILAAIGERLQWYIGELWIPSGEDGLRLVGADFVPTSRTYWQALPSRPAAAPQLWRVDLWFTPDAKADEFIDVSNRVVLATGEGLAGRIWQSGFPDWIVDVVRDKDFGPDSFAAKAGLHSALAFPIRSGTEMLGVMTFFGSEQLPPDENLLQMMAATGNQLGQFIKRKQAESALREQQQRTEKLLLNILPQPIAERLKQEVTTIADSFDEATVLFADLVGFTEMAAHYPPIELVEKLNLIFSIFDLLTEQYGLEKIKTIGDAYMVVGGLPKPRPDHADAIANMALDMLEAIAQVNRETQQNFVIRIGINTGSVVAGVIGTKKFIYDLWGDTVNIASRMESHGLPNSIQVTASTYERLQDHYQFQPRGPLEIKGKGKMITYLLLGRANSAAIQG
ncbi:MAG: PAS domain S-box protein [Spirulinaceae cyanobacterium SM2_1_0]|nr:PAS domain S-box protein [Spirulinaceae cyanobacterium SM2_1_0]